MEEISLTVTLRFREMIEMGVINLEDIESGMIQKRLGTLLTIITIIELTASEVLSPYGHRNG